MNKKNILIILVCFFLILSIFIYSFKDEIFNIFISNEKLSSKHFALYLALAFMYFLTPLPATLIIILTGFFFKFIGFFVSIMFLLIGSAILFIFAKNIKETFNINLNQFLKKKINLKKITNNNYTILILRYILPYFIHNILFGLENIKLKRFLIIIMFAEIPMVYALNTLGMSLNKLVKSINISILDIISDINFYVPFIIMIIIFIVINHLKKNFKIGL